jgi:hypothetical protein
VKGHTQSLDYFSAKSLSGDLFCFLELSIRGNDYKAPGWLEREFWHKKKALIGSLVGVGKN